MATVTSEDKMKQIKNPQQKLSDIQSLKEWCSKQPHLPKIEDSFLALFLHNNYYHIEPTKNMIENYYTTRTHVPEFFCNRDLLNNELQQSFEVLTVFPLEERTKDGYTMAYTAFLDTDPSRFVLNHYIKYCMMVVDMRLHTEDTSKGFIFIVNNKGMTFGHLAHVSPLTIKKCFYYIQEALPLHIRGIHFINTTPAIDMFMNMAKPFLKKKLADMIYLHPTMESVSKYFPIEALPNEAGGKAGSTRQLGEIQVKKLIEFREWFLEDEQTGRVNENLRIGRSKSASDLFGVEGSFKKLEID